MRGQERTAGTLFWEARREKLFGWVNGRRNRVAERLGLSLRTIERYESEGPPAWYDYALVGLWNYDQAVTRKEKPPDRSEG